MTVSSSRMMMRSIVFFLLVTIGQVITASYFNSCPVYPPTPGGGGNTCVAVTTFDNNLSSGVTLTNNKTLDAQVVNGTLRVISKNNTFFFFNLPVPYRGEHLSVLNGYLYFDLAQVFGISPPGTATPSNVTASEFAPNVFVDDIIIRGADRELYLNIPTPTANFTRYQLFLNESAGWYVTAKGSTEAGRAATAADMRAVFSYIECFLLRGNYYFSAVTPLNTSTTTYLDNIQLCEGLPPYGYCPKDCAGNGVCRKGVCNCYYGYSGVDCTIKAPCAVSRFPIPRYVAAWRPLGAISK